ncbi:MAG TPA: CbiX/SirB N-terminal domain-containing protein [Burkholderiales bacterium]|nr:CbiX/SirB N-terminal domain-containing protein [Burkholderiales bacterium]
MAAGESPAAKPLSAGIVLFAHGSRDPDWARPFEQLAAELAHKVSGSVALAYLELMRPPLDEAIALLVAKGATSIRVVPVFLGQGGHVKEDLPRLVERARKTHPKVAITLEPPIGEQPAVIDAIASAITRPADRPSS